jgi:hypothetical protein
MDQMVDHMQSEDAKSIEERLIDVLGDAIGGEGSLSLLSGGSIGQRHSVIANVLEEAEGMGCIVAVCDCSRSGTGTEPLSMALSDIQTDVRKKHGSVALPMPGVYVPVERSYRTEMEGLNILRSITKEGSLIMVLEEIGTASKATLEMFTFLARNIGDLNVLMVATHRSVDEDRLLADMLEGIRREVLVHDLHIRGAVGNMDENGPPIRHDGAVLRVGNTGPLSISIDQIVGHLSSSKSALASGDVCGSVQLAQAALRESVSICHYGLMLDSYVTLGTALTHSGKEKEAMEALDRGISLAITVGEVRSLHIARVLRSELLLFSVGEPDSAFEEAVSAMQLWSRSPEESHRIGPLALMAIIEARNGRRDRAEKAFCEASAMLESQPIDQLILERTQMAVAAALLLESRHDLNGMNTRYAEAMVLATGTEWPEYWAAVVSLQQVRSLLRLGRPREAKTYMEDASRRFDRLGNAIQSARVKRADEGSEMGSSQY